MIHAGCKDYIDTKLQKHHPNDTSIKGVIHCTNEIAEIKTLIKNDVPIMIKSICDLIETQTEEKEKMKEHQKVMIDRLDMLEKEVYKINDKLDDMKKADIVKPPAKRTLKK